MLYIHPIECIDCGACESVCPTEAIVPDRRMPHAWADFRDSAKELFADDDLSGGAGAIGPVPDTAFVVSRPAAN